MSWRCCWKQACTASDLSWSKSGPSQGGQDRMRDSPKKLLGEGIPATSSTESSRARAALSQRPPPPAPVKPTQRPPPPLIQAAAHPFWHSCCKFLLQLTLFFGSLQLVSSNTQTQQAVLYNCGVGGAIPNTSKRMSSIYVLMCMSLLLPVFDVLRK